MLDDVKRLAIKRDQSVLKWQLYSVLMFFLGAAVMAIISAGVFLLLEIGLIWTYATVLPSCLIMYFFIKQRLKKKVGNT